MANNRGVAEVVVGGIVPSIRMECDLTKLPLSMKLDLFGALYRDMGFGRVSAAAQAEIDAVWKEHVEAIKKTEGR